MDGSYSSVTMSGTFDPTGATCSDPAAATQICQALHDGSFASVFCNGHAWNVGQCGGVRGRERKHRARRLGIGGVLAQE